MLVMNQQMHNQYQEARTKHLAQKNLRLSEIAKSGFELRDGCYFLKQLIPTETNVNAGSFPDRTGYECFINHIHLDDYVDSDYLVHGIDYIRQVFLTWNKRYRKRKLIAVLAISESSPTVRFHTKRSGEQWLSDNMEGYEEPVLTVDSSEIGFP